MPQTRRGRLGGQELAFVRTVSAVQVQNGLTYREFTARLRQIERLHIEQLSGNRYLIRETKRRIAELLLKEAICRGCSFGVCGARMKELQALGFTDIEQKSTYSFFYARSARDHGHPRTARQIAMMMVRELERSLRRRRSLLTKENLRVLRVLLTELEQS